MRQFVFGFVEGLWGYLGETFCIGGMRFVYVDYYYIQEGVYSGW